MRTQQTVDWMRQLSRLSAPCAANLNKHDLCVFCRMFDKFIRLSVVCTDRHSYHSLLCVSSMHQRCSCSYMGDVNGVWACSNTFHLAQCSCRMYILSHSVLISSLIFANGQFMQIIQFQRRYICIAVCLEIRTIFNNRATRWTGMFCAPEEACQRDI